MPSWASLAHAFHDSTRDAGSNFVSMLREGTGGVKEVLIAAMAEVRAATVAGFQVLPAVVPAMAQGVVALCGLATVAVNAPGAVAALSATAGAVRAGGVVPFLRSFFGV